MALRLRPADWERYRAIVQRVYIDENKGVPEVKRALASKGFQVTSRQCKGIIKKWRMVKYVKQKEKNAMLLIREQRTRKGKATLFRKYKRIVPAHTLRRYERKLKSSGEGLDPDQTSMSGVSFKTPSQGGRDNHQPGTWRSTRDRPPAATEQDLSHIGSSFQTCGPPQPALQGFVGCETALHAAIRNRSGELEELIGGGARVDAVDRDDNTALHLAANQGDTHVVQLLLENRAPTDVLNRVLQTPLHNAITAPEGGAAAAAVLLRFGANPNLPGGGAPLCDTPLHAAVRLCDRDKVALLLRHGADISARNAGQDTPLTVAVDKGHLRIVELLLRHSPHAAAVLTHQDDLCSRAARLGHSDIASLMTPRCDPYSARDDGMSNGPGSFFWMISLDVRR